MELKELLEIIYGAIGSTVIPAFTVFLGYQINKFIQSKVSVDEQEQIDGIIKASVVWVEQITGVDLEYEAKEKFNFAKNRALELLKGAGLEVSEEYLDTLIEVFVNGLHSDRANELESHINKIMGDDKK